MRIMWRSTAVKLLLSVLLVCSIFLGAHARQRGRQRPPKVALPRESVSNVRDTCQQGTRGHTLVSPGYHLGVARTCSRRDPRPDFSLLLIHPTSPEALSGPLQSVGAAFREVLAWLPPATSAPQLAEWGSTLWGSAHLRAIDPNTTSVPPFPRLMRGAEALTSEVVLLVWGNDAAWLSPSTIQVLLQRFQAEPALGMLSVTNSDKQQLEASKACAGGQVPGALVFHPSDAGHIALRRAALLDALLCLDGCLPPLIGLSEAFWAAGWAVAGLRLLGLPQARPLPTAMLATTCSTSKELSSAACQAFRQFENGVSEANGDSVGGTKCSPRRDTRLSHCPLPRGPSPPRWTVVIQYYQQPGFLSRLLAGLGAVLHTAHSTVELIVMDDSASEIDEWLSGLSALNGVYRTLFVAANNLHEIRSYNAAARLASGELLALLQDDDDPGAEPGWLAAAGDLLSAHPRMALLGGHRGRLDCAPDGGEARMDEKRRMADGLKFGPGHIPIPTLDPTTRQPFMFAYKVNAAPLIVRRSLLLELGGLHRELSCAGEAGIGYDFELSVRMWAEGYQVGLFYSGFDRAAHGSDDKKDDPNANTAGADSRKTSAKTTFVSGTRANKSTHKQRISNYHANNQALYQLYPHVHHRNGTLMALAACRELPLSASALADPQWRALLAPMDWVQ